MSKDHEVLDYVLDVTPDTDRHGRLRHVVALDRICGDSGIINDFLDREEISLRKLFNYLDGDPRGQDGYTNCIVAGTMLTIASLHKINVDREDDEAYDSFEDLVEKMDEEFNNTLHASIDNMTSYLFGRHTLTEDFRKKNIEAYEEMYEICENLLWTLALTLADEVNEIEAIAEIINEDPYVYPVARWEDDVMLVTFYSSNHDISHRAFFHILDRGYTTDERYYSTHRSRSRHRVVPKRGGTHR